MREGGGGSLLVGDGTDVGRWRPGVDEWLLNTRGVGSERNCRSKTPTNRLDVEVREDERTVGGPGRSLSS